MLIQMVVIVISLLAFWLLGLWLVGQVARLFAPKTEVDMNHKCIYCNKLTKEKLYVITFDKESALFHLSCFKQANPDLIADIEYYLDYKKKIDKKEER